MIISEVAKTQPDKDCTQVKKKKRTRLAAFAQVGQETQRSDTDEACSQGLADALRCFKQGDYESCMTLARKSKELCQERTWSRSAPRAWLLRALYF